MGTALIAPGRPAAPARRASGPRYGIASDATLFIGKVLSNQGSARVAPPWRGSSGALRNGCQVISISVGTPVAVGEPFSVAFEQVAQAALAAKCADLAAAGNQRKGESGVSHR